MHVYRWDLDRTYLDSAIHGVRELIRSALEDASAKRTLPGAAPLLRGLVASDPSAKVCILSGSPRQMRRVLEEKLALDGVVFHRLILKDNLRNLRKGRLRALRGQIGYKLPALLVERLDAPAHARESLFGDDSEADALIYVAYAELLAGRLGADDLRALLLRGGAYEDQVEIALDAAARVPRGDAVDHIFIRLDRRSPPERFGLLGPRVSLVFHWLQAALVLARDERLHAEGLRRVVDDATEDLGATGVHGLVQDACLRGLLHPDAAEGLLRDAGHPIRLDPAPADPRPPASVSPDYLGFLDWLDRRDGAGT